MSLPTGDLRALERWGRAIAGDEGAPAASLLRAALRVVDRGRLVSHWAEDSSDGTLTTDDEKSEAVARLAAGLNDAFRALLVLLRSWEGDATPWNVAAALAGVGIQAAGEAMRNTPQLAERWTADGPATDKIFDYLADIALLGAPSDPLELPKMRPDPILGESCPAGDVYRLLDSPPAFEDWLHLLLAKPAEHGRDWHGVDGEILLGPGLVDQALGEGCNAWRKVGLALARAQIEPDSWIRLALARGVS